MIAAVIGITQFLIPANQYKTAGSDNDFAGSGSVIVDFAIEGKWKNVGDDGYGQAQPGAIVAFDGTHCNYYNPYDVYAFYYDDSNYKLEVTGLLGDACSFTVNIVDNDNIEVIDDYGTISLMWLE